MNETLIPTRVAVFCCNWGTPNCNWGTPNIPHHGVHLLDQHGSAFVSQYFATFAEAIAFADRMRHVIAAYAARAAR